MTAKKIQPFKTEPACDPNKCACGSTENLSPRDPAYAPELVCEECIEAEINVRQWEVVD